MRRLPQPAELPDLTSRPSHRLQRHPVPLWLTARLVAVSSFNGHRRDPLITAADSGVPEPGTFGGPITSYCCVETTVRSNYGRRNPSAWDSRRCKAVCGCFRRLGGLTAGFSIRTEGAS